MSTRYKLIATLTIILALVAGCGRVQPTATPVPPTDTPAPPTATPIPPTDTPVPPTATQTPILLTTEPSPTAAPATEPGVTSNTWIKTYGGNQDILCGDVLLADDGGYFIAGTANLEFEPEVRGDVYLMRTDAAGEILWEKAYGGEGYEGGQSIILADDGNLLIAGRTTSFGVEGTDAYLIKVDQNGDEIWSKTFGGPLDEGVSVVRQTTDGGYILVGNIVDPNDFVADPGAAGRSNIYLVRTDGDGNELWSRAYDSEDNIMASSGLQTPDGGFLALATIMYFPDSGDDIYLLKVDENGNEVWSSTWEEGTTGGYDLIQTSDGNYLITGSYVPPGDTDDEKEDFLFIKVDPAGNEIWMSIFGDPDMIDYGFVLAETGDGGYVTVAERTRDRYTGDADIAFVKVDENGQLLWERSRTASHTMLSTILQHPDGGYVISGSTFRDPVFNIMLIKTDSEGDISALPTTSQTVASMPPAATSTPALPAPQETPVPLSPIVADIIASLEGLPIDQFFEQSHVQLQLRDPDNLISNGLAEEYGGEHNDRFSDMSDAYIRETQQLEAAVLDLLRAYDRSALSPEQQLSYDIYEWNLDDLVRGHEFMYYNYPVNSSGMWSLQYWFIIFMTEDLVIASKSDAEDYVARLSQAGVWVEQLLEGLKLRQEAGVIPPKYVIQGTIPQIEMFIQTPEGMALNPRASALYISFRERMREVDEISSQERQALLDAAEVEIEETFMPAFTKLRDYLVRLESVAPNGLGVGQFPRGEAFYDYALRHWTGLDISADQVHELGLAEVARIQAEMRAVAVAMGYPADISMAEMAQLVAERDILTGEELRQEYERLIAEAAQAAQEYFDLFPSTDVIVEYDPDSLVPAFYQLPPRDGSGPGRMIVNLQDSAQSIFYNEYTLTHHEAIPGHHVQHALSEELDLPKFRRDAMFSVARQYFIYEAFTDGWALYAKQLAWEMGLYGDDLLANLGRLRLFLRFATSIVVDTGIHSQGWSLQQAVDYKEQATGMTFSPHRLTKMINVPGQMCGCYLGYFKILELRQRAMDQLGDQFDIKEFHNVVLGNGPMPLEILERLVDDWIETRMNQ